MIHWTGAMRWMAVLTAPILLTSCLLIPTRFQSTLDIGQDRSFTFTYVGEVQLLETSPSDIPTETNEGVIDNDAQLAPATAAYQTQPSPNRDGTEGEEAQFRRLVEALSKEYGYRSVRYLGERLLAIDYRISGNLDHGFVFPFNLDGEILTPFLAIELRGRDRIRVKAPGFAAEANGTSTSSMIPANKNPASLLDGQFTLTTSAEIISQNQEDGAQKLPDGRRRISWTITPATQDAPTAVLEVSPRP
jgi:hypothetical protein